MSVARLLLDLIKIFKMAAELYNRVLSVFLSACKLASVLDNLSSLCGSSNHPPKYSPVPHFASHFVGCHNVPSELMYD